MFKKFINPLKISHNFGKNYRSFSFFNNHVRCTLHYVMYVPNANDINRRICLFLYVYIFSSVANFR